MKKYLFALMISFNVFAFQSGNAPFCLMDDYGNLQCYYYTLSACQQMAGIGQTCVRR